MQFKKIFISILAIFGFAFASVLPAFADTISVNFENPYVVGDINGQQGWMKTGGYDVAVASVSAFPNASSFGFETQALRLSNSVTSGAFGDQTFSPGLANPAGESLANNHFDASFSIGSTQSTQQPGLFLSVSPDDGNGSRMSYAGFDDQADGIHVIFYDATDPGPLGTVATFNQHDVATIDRTSAHTIRFSIDFLPGKTNDVARLYVDGTLKFTGTTWEDYYRYDPEQNGNGNVVPTTSKLLLREGGTAVPENAGNGYLVDNVTLSSGPIVTPTPTPTPTPVLIGPPTAISQCKDGGWQTFNNPSFKNQGQCVKYVLEHNHSVQGAIKYTANGLKRSAEFSMDTAFDKGSFVYQDANHDWYMVDVSHVVVNGNKAWFAGKVTFASQPSWKGLWLFAEVQGSFPLGGKIWGSFTDQTTATNGVNAMSDPADGPFTVTQGFIWVH